MELKTFDEQEALAFIRKQVGEEVSGRCSDDDLFLLIDTIFDYYDDHDDDDDFEPTFEETAAWVAKQLKKDRDCKILPEDVLALVKAEDDYESTLFEI